MKQQPNARMVEDIQLYMSACVHKLVKDTADTCHRGDLEPIETLQIVIGGLLPELVRACTIVCNDRDDFIELCQLAWDNLADEYIDALKRNG